ncbi:MAG: hypothetical protein R6X02_25615 [Enhygromyxa sp.]
MRGSRLTAVLALASVAALGCKEGAEGRPDLEAAAAAALGEGKDDKAKELEAKAAEERKRKFEERKAKEAEQQAKLDAIAAAVVKAPAKPSKNLAAACDALVGVYSDWVKAVYFDDDGFQLSFFDTKHKNLGEVKGKCAKRASVEATDCMVEVIKAVSAEDYPEEERKLIQAQPDYLFTQCVEKFAPETR